MSENKVHIIITLNAQRLAFDINREDEPFYRKAQNMLNERFAVYQRKRPNDSAEKIWMYVAFWVAVNLFAQSRDKDIEPYLKAIRDINREIENKLNNNIN